MYTVTVSFVIGARRYVSDSTLAWFADKIRELYALYYPITLDLSDAIASTIYFFLHSIFYILKLTFFFIDIHAFTKIHTLVVNFEDERAKPTIICTEDNPEDPRIKPAKSASMLFFSCIFLFYFLTFKKKTKRIDKIHRKLAKIGDKKNTSWHHRGKWWERMRENKEKKKKKKKK